MGLSPGCLISLEGVDAAGKSTQVAALMARLSASGVEAVAVSQDATSLGAVLQERLLGLRGGAPLEPWTEALLFTAGRVQLLHERILPALRRGLVVVADRFSDSTLAYQGGGRGLDVEALRRLQHQACAGVWPDLTILLALPPTEAGRRQRQAATALDRFETAPGDFQQRVAACFSKLAEAEPQRFVVVDASASPDGVADQVEEAVLHRLRAAHGRA